MNKSRLVKRILCGLALIPVLALLAVGYLYLNQRHMMYKPDTARPDPAAYGAQGAEIFKAATADGLALEGWYFPPRTASKPVIVIFHGNVSHYGNRYKKTHAYLKAGYGVLLAGYRGYGGNPGKPTEQGLYSDARAFLNTLIERGVQPERIVLYGESLGSGVAVQMANEYKAAALVLEAPYVSTVAVARLTYPFLPLDILMHDRFESVEKLKNLGMPVMIIHGEDDRVIPITQGRELFARLSGYDNRPAQDIFVAVPGAAHNNLYDHDAALHVLEFLRSIGK